MIGDSIRRGLIRDLIRWALDLKGQTSTFSCTSERLVWGYIGNPSELNPPQLITVPAQIPAITGGRYLSAETKFYTTDINDNTLCPFTEKQTPDGKIRIFTPYTDYTATGYLAGEQVAKKTTAGNRVYLTCLAPGTAVSVTVTEADIGTDIADAGGFSWRVGGYATIEGQLLEPAATKRALWNRDLTNAASAVWVKTNITVAKDATGADGTATSASTLTATANAGTILQTVTIASAAFAFAPYVKRKTGTGTVEVTIDNGGTWVDITADINSNYWVRALASKTAANPIFGFRLAVDTDEIIVDFADMEGGASGTSPQIVTSGNVVRAATLLTALTAGRLTAASAAGRIIFKLNSAFNSASDHIFSTYNEVDLNAVSIKMQTGSKTRLQLYKSGSLEATIDVASVWTIGSTYTIEFYYGTSGCGCRVSIDGGAFTAWVTDAYAGGITLEPLMSFLSHTLGGRPIDGALISCELSDKKEDLNFE